MMRIFKRRVSVALRVETEAKLHTIANHAAPNETGGILLGWWDGKTIVVEDVAEVTDTEATSHSWTRHEDKAQEILDTALTQASNSPLGYVGDWHSHPAICDASSTDIKSLQRASRQYSKPLLLVVRMSNGKLDIHTAQQGKQCQTTVNTRYIGGLK